MRDFQSQNGVTSCILGLFGSIVLDIIILLIAHSLKRQAVASRIIMQHASSCISIMHHESCQEIQNLRMCLLFLNPNPIRNR